MNQLANKYVFYNYIINIENFFFKNYITKSILIFSGLVIMSCESDTSDDYLKISRNNIKESITTKDSIVTKNTPPLINFSQNWLKFERVSINDKQKLDLIITNNSDLNVNVELLEKEAVNPTSTNYIPTFKVEPNFISLSAKASKTVSVEFAPTRWKNYGEYFDISISTDQNSNIEHDLFINFSGEGFPPRPTKYNDFIKHMISVTCLGCHNSADRKGGISLNTYDELKKSFDGSTNYDSFYQIRSGLMPKNYDNEIPLYSESQKLLLQNWIDDGYLE